MSNGIAVVEQVAQRVDLHFVAGDDFIFATNPITVDGAPLDLSGYTITVQIRDGVTGALLLSPTVTVSGADNNVLSFELTSSNTRDDIGAGTAAVWGLEWVTGGRPREVMGGSVVVDAERVHS